MTTGKVEYAPDYKSQFEIAMDEGAKMAEGIIATLKESDERERLRDAVVEAAIKQRRLVLRHLDDRPLQDLQPTAVGSKERRERGG